MTIADYLLVALAVVTIGAFVASFTTTTADDSFWSKVKSVLTDYSDKTKKGG